MKLTDRVIDFSYKRQKWIEGLAIFFMFLGVSFKYELSQTNWVWEDYPFIAVFIVGFSLFLIIIWLKVERSKIQKTIDQIHNDSGKNKSHNLLSNRQQEVFDLILQNKSNKQISEELFIGLSTLKTHINKIYKILDIKNRKEAKKYNS